VSELARKRFKTNTRMADERLLVCVSRFICSTNSVIALPSFLAISRKPCQNSSSNDTLVLFPFTTIECLMTVLIQQGWECACRLDVPTVIRTMKWRDGCPPFRSSISCNRCTQMSACHRLNQLPQFPKATFASHSSRIWVAQIDEAAEYVCVYA
jgi:hypothetical protein